VTESDDHPWELALRVPEWASGARLGDGGEKRKVGPGMASVRRRFVVGDLVELELPMSPRWIVPDPRIDAIRGCVAVEQGPLVMCVESVDLPAGVEMDMIRVDPGRDLEESYGGIVAPGRLVDVEDMGWPYAAKVGETATGTDLSILLTPYHSWANRGPSTMRVWVPTVGSE
jgi:hypothetical protein